MRSRPIWRAARSPRRGVPPRQRGASGSGPVGAAEVGVDRGQFADRWREANELPGRHGGFVVDSSAETTGGLLARGSLTARVPAANLDAVVRDLRRLGTPVRVTDEGHDVSPQLVDYD